MMKGWFGVAYCILYIISCASAQTNFVKDAGEILPWLSFMLLENQDLDAFNQRSSEILDESGGSTVECGLCLESPLGAIPDEISFEGLQGTDFIITDGVDYIPEVFERGCGILYAANPSVVDRISGTRYLSEQVGVTFSAGCRTRFVNRSWDNMGCGRGGGYHREYLMDVLQKTKVSVGGRVCWENTLVIPPKEGQVSSFEVFSVNCTVEEEDERITVENECLGYTVIDSSYYVVGWKKVCDRQSIATLIADRCKKSSCVSANPRSEAAHACARNCERMSKNIAENACEPDRSEEAICPNEVHSLFGSPDLGSSVYHIPLPKDSDYCLRFCTLEDDLENSCFNNRVSLESKQALICRDEMNLSIVRDNTIEAVGSFDERVDYVDAWVEIAHPGFDIDTLLISDVPLRLYEYFPIHSLYKIDENSSGAEDKFLFSLAEDDYRANKTINLSGYVDFVNVEKVPNLSPPTVGANLSIRGYSQKEDVMLLNLILAGGKKDLDELKVHLLSPKDILDAGTRSCNPQNPCMDGFCLHDRCIPQGAGTEVDLSGIDAAKETSIEIVAESETKASEDTSVRFLLSSGGLPLTGEKLDIGCQEKTVSCITDEGGSCTLSFNAPNTPIVCSGVFRSRLGYKGARIERIFHVTQKRVDLSPLWMLLIILIFFAVIFTVASGGRRLPDVLDTIRGWIN